MSDPDLQSLWQSQPAEEVPMPLDEIRRQAGRFQDRIRVRNLVEYVAGVVVVAMFGWQALRADHVLVAASCWATVAATFVVLWQLHVRSAPRRLPETAVALIDFHRAELERQRDAVASVPLWYLGPFVPGLLLMFAGRWLEERAEADGGELIRVIGGMSVVLLVFAGVAVLNRFAARALQKEIDKLDAARAEGAPTFRRSD